MAGGKGGVRVCGVSIRSGFEDCTKSCEEGNEVGE